MTYDSAPAIGTHQVKVLKLLWSMIHKLARRAHTHDASKLYPPEKEMYDGVCAQTQKTEVWK